MRVWEFLFPGVFDPASREVPMNLIHTLLDLAQAIVDVLRIVFAR
ncbi:hypothetical protein [Rhodococcus ruber]